VSLLALAFAASSTAPTASNDGPAYGAGTGLVQTGSVNITVTGGTAPYTYSTAYLSGNTATIIGGTTSTVAFSRSGVLITSYFSGVARCTVTDAKGRTATTDIGWTIEGA
jgi:hypothetical protein